MWSLSARGTKAHVLDVVTKTSATTSDDQAQLAGVKQLLAIEIHAAPADREIIVAASGGRTTDGHDARSYVSVSFNASALPKRTAEQSPID
jgi:hypothetical protein